MNEYTLIIIIGLCLDIIGAYVVLRPLIHLYKRYWGNQTPDLKSEEVGFLPPEKEIVNSQIRDMKEARIGFIILVTGFVFQMIGNLL